MMTHPFDLRSINGEQQAWVIRAYCSHQFYLPPAIIDHPDIAIGRFDILTGPQAADTICDFLLAVPHATIQGDLPIGAIKLANAVGVSVRRYIPDNTTHLVYKLWNRKDAIRSERHHEI